MHLDPVTLRRHAKTSIDKLVKDLEIGEDEGARAGEGSGCY